MNLFILSEDPVIAAQEQCDKHVVKMIVESAQMLSTTHRMLDGKLYHELSKNNRKVKRYRLPDDREDVLYKAVHFNHPCTVWTRESVANYEWHYKHFVALCDEYKYRYGKVHATDTLLRHYLDELPLNIPDIPQTAFKLAMKSNPECMFPNDPVKSYKLYYQTKQDRFKMAWTNRKVPEWFNATKTKDQRAA